MENFLTKIFLGDNNSGKGSSGQFHGWKSRWYSQMIPNEADSRWLDISCPLFELVRGDEISWIQKYGRKVVQIIQSIPRERPNSDKKYGFRFLVLKYDSYSVLWRPSNQPVRTSRSSNRMAARNREASRASRVHSRPPRGPPIPRAVPVSNQNDELFQFTSLKFEFLNFDRSELNIRTINSKKPNYIQGLSLSQSESELEASDWNFFDFKDGWKILNFIIWNLVFTQWNFQNQVNMKLFYRVGARTGSGVRIWTDHGSVVRTMDPW